MSWAERQAQWKKEENDERRNAYIQAHPETPEKMKQYILKGSIVIGMTKEQAIASWGKPQKINKTGTRYGVREQWCYGYYETIGYTRKFLHTTNYVYFENGKLTSWQSLD